MSAVDILGLVAGAVWLLAAIYLEMIRDDRAPIEYVVGFTGVGSALIMLSAAPLSTSHQLTTLLIVGAYLMFLVLGVAAWYWADHVDLRSTDPDTPDDHSLF